MLVRMLRGMAIGAGAAFGLAMIAPAAARAQDGTRFGVEAAFGANNSVGIGVGAFGKMHLTEISGHPITGRVSFDYYFPSGLKYWELAADGLFDIATDKADLKPYAGAGLTYSHSSFTYASGYCDLFGSSCSASGSSTGLHIVGGLNFMSNSSLKPFVEVKVELSSGTQLVLKGGIHIK